MKEIKSNLTQYDNGYETFIYPFCHAEIQLIFNNKLT